MRFRFDDVMDWLYHHQTAFIGLILAVLSGFLWVQAAARTELRERCIDACAPAGGAWSSDLSTCLCIDDRGIKSLRKPAE